MRARKLVTILAAATVMMKMTNETSRLRSRKSRIAECVGDSVLP